MECTRPFKRRMVANAESEEDGMTVPAEVRSTLPGTVLQTQSTKVSGFADEGVGYEDLQAMKPMAASCTTCSCTTCTTDTESHLIAAGIQLGVASATGGVTAKLLVDMRALILGGGRHLQVTACRPLIFDAVVECLLGGSDSSVLEAACRLVCTISAKNSETQAHVLADARILSKILALIQASTSNHISTTAIAAAAMWALSALVMCNPQRQSEVCADMVVVQNITAFLRRPCEQEEVHSASAWALCNLAAGVPSVQTLFGENGVMEALLKFIQNSSATQNSKGLAACAVRVIVFVHPPNQLRAFASHAIDILGTLLVAGVPATAQASALFAAGSVSLGIPDIQNYIRTNSKGVVLARIVQLLDSQETQVQCQAAITLGTISSRNAENQSAVAGLGGLDKLAAIMRHNIHRPVLIEKVLTAMIFILTKNPKNQQLLSLACTWPCYAYVQGSNRRALQDIALLQCSKVVSIQGLAASIIRMTVEHPVTKWVHEIQMIFIALGALGSLLATICESSDPFAQKQAAGALCNLLANPASVPFFRALNGEMALASILTSNDDIKKFMPPDIALMCIMKCLFYIGHAAPDVFVNLYKLPGLTASLLQISDYSGRSPELRLNAGRLLRLMVPLGVSTVNLLLRTLQPLSSGVPGLSCCICMSEETTSSISTTIPLVFLPCFHAFHISCIESWLVRGAGNSCPICKNPVLVNIQNLLRDW